MSNSGSYITIEINSNLDKVLENVDKIREKTLQQIGMGVQRSASRACPRDTGRLSNSITYATQKKHSAVRGKAKISDGMQTGQAGDQYTVVVGTNVEYAAFVEMGHHQEVGRYVPAIGARLVREFVPGQAFLKPALESNTGNIRDIIQKNFNEL